MSEQIVILWGAILQPLLIRWAAGSVHGFLKYTLLVVISIAAGFVMCLVEGDLKDLPLLAIKILVYSLGAWGGLWKKVFPNKDNPLTPENEGTDNLYTVNYMTEDGVKQRIVRGKTAHRAMRTVMRKINVDKV